MEITPNNAPRIIPKKDNITSFPVSDWECLTEALPLAVIKVSTFYNSFPPHNSKKR
jgi:hypothetical protein